MFQRENFLSFRFIITAAVMVGKASERIINIRRNFLLFSASCFFFHSHNSKEIRNTAGIKWKKKKLMMKIPSVLSRIHKWSWWWKRFHYFFSLFFLYITHTYKNIQSFNTLRGELSCQNNPVCSEMKFLFLFSLPSSLKQ